MLDVIRLRVLVAVAQHGSVTAAARALNYAQPSISHHIARLEAETGARLLQRAGRGVRLTDAGRLLAERAEEIIGRLDAAEAELAAHVGLREGRVRLAAFPSALGTIVPAAAARLEAETPGMDLMLTEAEPPEALRMLRAGYVDVALVFQHYQQDTDPAPPSAGEDGTRGRLLLDEPVHLVTATAPVGHSPAGHSPAGHSPAGHSPAEHSPAEHRAAGHSPTGHASPPHSSAPSESPLEADLSAYSSHRWIAGCERCRSYLIRQCALAGFTPKVAFTTDDYVAVQALVAAGLGVTTLPGLCLRAARHPGITATPLPGARRYIFAVTYGDPPDPPATARLLDVLAQVAGADGTTGTTGHSDHQR
jgi:DNA-binding transcriptional LysR family regulator